ncbi:Crp/Fnr family transcriptional regulator [Methylobacterium sp. Leaf123]|uniref:Crp/Fnr family transcriptional regulator n=1 Tax=Methylobacterium sp. Leaf123 TaxID=1736264 RepID=UPI002570299A|nr:Crp/Fnr family transcriptional regulator [Methylobacterium sp. Leaf123]
MTPLAWLVRRLDEAALLDGAARRALLTLAPQERLVPARTGIRDGRKSGGAHLILQGVACRTAMLPDGTRRILALYFPGDLCTAECGAADQLPGAIEALSPCTVADIPSGTIDSLIRSHPGIERALWWLTLVELGIAQQWLINAGWEAERRIAHLVCEVRARSQAAGGDIEECFASGVRQGVVADIAALSTVHVSRVLHALQAARLITLNRGAAAVPQPAPLIAFAGFDPGYLHLPDHTARAKPESSAGIRHDPAPWAGSNRDLGHESRT